MSKFGIRHGHLRTGGDGGATGILNEIDVVEEYYKLVMNGLRSQGHTVVDCTPSDGATLSESLSYGINKAKEEECEFFISCHANATDNHQGNGCMVLYSSYNSKSQTLAKNIDKAISEIGFKDNGAIVSDRNLYEINHGNEDGLTAVIIEPFFIDNQIDVDKYKDIGASGLANAIVKGITGNEFIVTTPTVASNNSKRTDDYETIELDQTNYEVVSGSKTSGEIMYGRRCRVIFADKDDNAFDVSELRAVFNCTKSMAMEPNLSVIKIYNLNVPTENKIKNDMVRVTIEAGYEGNIFGQIFDGDIIQAISYKEDATTFVLEILAVDCDRAINFNFVNFTLTKGLTQRKQLEEISNRAGNPVSLGSISSKLNVKALTRGKTFFGKQSDYVRQLARSNELQGYYENGEINIIDVGELPEGEILEIGTQSGLVGFPEQTDFGIEIKCLINPLLKINTLFHIDNTLIKAKRVQVSSSNTVPANNENTTITNLTGVRNKIIEEAKRLCDDPNVRYSMPLRNQTIDGITYYDCSSFVTKCYAVAGLTLNGNNTVGEFAEVKQNGIFVTEDEAKAGDIVFWGQGSECSHVAIYDGNGGCYAARGVDNKTPDEQVSYCTLYGNPFFGQPKCLTDNETNNVPTVAKVKGGSR